MRMSGDERTLSLIVGSATFRRGQEYFTSGAVLEFEVARDVRRATGQVLGSGRKTYQCSVDVTWGTDGSLNGFRGACSCPVGHDCKHSVALALASLLDDHSLEREQDPDEVPTRLQARIATTPAPAASGPATSRPAASSPSATVTPLFAPWERMLQDVVAEADEEPEDEAAVALQFELTRPRGQAAPAVDLRPVLRGNSGRWGRTGISWSELLHSPYRLHRVSPEHVRLLKEIAQLAGGLQQSYISYRATSPINLAGVESRRIWDLLDEAGRLGLPLVDSGPRAAPVVVTEPAEPTLDLTARGDVLTLRPSATVGGEAVPLESAMLIGANPAHGIAWSDTRNGEPVLRLARLATPLPTGLRKLFAPTPLVIGEAHRDRFFSHYFPALRERLPIGSSDGSVEVPEPSPPVLVLTVQHLIGHRADVTWRWRYALGDAVRTEPLHAVGVRATGRDLALERARLEEVAAAAKAVAELWETPVGTGERRLIGSTALSGMAVVRLMSDVLPQLREVPDLVVDVLGEPVAYREAEAAPVVRIEGTQADGTQADGASTESGRDWFDLAVNVTVEGEAVPFELLFSALARGQSELILPSGTWFGLERPEFRVLADLIAEARSLQEHDGETLRLSRYQTSFWAELEKVGVVTGQAAEWQRQVSSLADLDTMDEVPVPAGLHADLRPYQRVGYSWLSFLYRHGLGGVLADEMGLGKTLQALALFVAARETAPEGAPFLVVAPTSVVPNWVSECHRFAPGLRVRAVTETKARRSESLAELAGGADVVVTSYTLFRLEGELYRGLEWSGLVLDEAQFVKNHKSKAYACARMLSVPFKLAITGTPMENNLMELWSLLSITAPGLFASPVRFEQTYRTPIEKQGNTELLQRLRRRVKPLMLRRSKEEVVTDLPAKQEQVLELPLNAKHRKVYQTHLQRERQKVLGLLGDLDNNRFEVFRSLTMLRQASLDPALIDPKYSDIPSTKLDHLAEQLDEITREGHRVLVFSQFTRFLTSARKRAEAAGIDSCYLDGKTRDRAAVIDSFKNGEAPVFFISLKAGGFGLNLTEADYCILLDPWWNPATEAQAVDRVHRIGQTKQVMVYRLVAQDTIEDKVMALKAGKSALFDSVLDGGEFTGGGLTADDIRGMLD
jgi:hypothetical protein